MLGDDVRQGDPKAERDGHYLVLLLRVLYGLFARPLRALHEQVLVLGFGEEVPAVQRL